MYYEGEVPSKIFVMCQLTLLNHPHFDQTYSNSSFKLVIHLLKIRYERIKNEQNKKSSYPKSPKSPRSPRNYDDESSDVETDTE